jgi:extradiol dioxygenase family protein
MSTGWGVGQDANSPAGAMFGSTGCITLHKRPDKVLTDEQRGVRHFGITLGTDEVDRLVDRVNKHDVRWLAPLSTDYAGTSAEQRKGKILDPSGNAIEIKAYIDREARFAAVGRPSG